MNNEIKESVSKASAYYQPVPSYTRNPENLSTLWTWWFILLIVGVPLSFVFIGIPMVIAAAVIGYVMLYKWWAIIQDGKARTTPGQAVGFCFIPLFNLYWIYVTFVGLVKDMNNYCRERQIPVQISEGLAITYYVLFLVTILTSWTVILFFVMLLPTFIVGAILSKSITDGAIKIIRAKQEDDKSRSIIK